MEFQFVRQFPEKLRTERAKLDSLLFYNVLWYMSNVGYILDVWYKDRLLKAFIEVNSKWKSRMMIEIRIDELLEKRERSFYWLSKQSGISHTTLWRLKKGKALGINFATLEKICEILDCEPGDLLKFSKAEKKEVTESSK